MAEQRLEYDILWCYFIQEKKNVTKGNISHISWKLASNIKTRYDLLTYVWQQTNIKQNCNDVEMNKEKPDCHIL